MDTLHVSISCRSVPCKVRGITSFEGRLVVCGGGRTLLLFSWWRMDDVAKSACGWCEDPRACKNKDCDFATLPKEKDAILKRMAEERVKIGELTEYAKSTHDVEQKKAAVLICMDKHAGLRRMVSALHEFGVSEEEAYRLAGFTQANALQKVQLALLKKQLLRGAG